MKTLKMTRKDLIKSAAKKPLHELQWNEIRGTADAFSRADIVLVSDGGKTRIFKDRQCAHVNITRDKDGLVDTALLPSV